MRRQTSQVVRKGTPGKARRRSADLHVVGLAGGTDMIAEDATARIDFGKSVVIHKGKSYTFPALPKEVLAILNDGGLIPHVKKALAGAKS